jgi:hypothetical protein
VNNNKGKQVFGEAVDTVLADSIVAHAIKNAHESTPPEGKKDESPVAESYAPDESEAASRKSRSGLFAVLAIAGIVVMGLVALIRKLRK